MKMGAMDAKKMALEELMKHLDGVDGEEMKGAMAPKAAEIEVVAAGGGEDVPEDAAVASASGSASEGMPEGDIEELIEALQAKLNC